MMEDAVRPGRDREDLHECIRLMLVTDDLAPPEVSFITSASHTQQQFPHQCLYR